MTELSSTEPSEHEAQSAHIAERIATAIAQVERVFVGPKGVCELLMIALLSRGHVLLEGVPGVAKTTLVKAFAGTLGCDFRRIQFTPDLLPADITGTYVLSPKEGSFSLREGPLFAHVVLGDEINRAPAKTQSALLEAMQERQVTIEGNTRPLPDPFIVLATQNPLEQAGTYPLPEAQVDRFLVRLIMGYPSADDERRILMRFMAPAETVEPVFTPEEIRRMQGAVMNVHVDEHLLDYVVRLAQFTRQHGQVLLGASPRASLALSQCARARALMEGRAYATPDDIKALAGPVLGHRLVLTAEAEMAGATPEQILSQALERVPLRSQAR